MGRHKAFYYIFCRELMFPFNSPFKTAKSHTEPVQREDGPDSFRTLSAESTRGFKPGSEGLVVSSRYSSSDLPLQEAVHIYDSPVQI
jgi:hypothetical protein